jgi:RNA polymerase sigma-70 factor (ECF subfamily)
LNKPSDNTFLSIEDFLIHIEKRAFVMARTATGDKEEALDIVQDAMIKLVTNYSNKESSDWPPLFHRILQNLINDWHRRQKVRNTWRRWLGNNSNDENNFRDSPLENKSDEQDQLPEQELGNLEFSQSLENAVIALPLRQKQAFMLRAWEEYSTRETSQIMSCSEGSVKTHYSRALASLRTCLEREGMAL